MERNEKSAILVKKVLEGDSSAFEELYQSTYKSVFYHAQQILKNEQDVEDAVSETYMRAYENLGKLKDPALFPAWINRIATNLSLKMVRDDRFRDSESLDDEDFYYEPVAADADTPNMVLDRKGTEEIVGGMIEALPDVQRATVIMYYYDEMSVPAIAKAMDCSEGTVKSRLKYARKNLERAVLAEEKRGVKLYTVSPTLVFGAITLLIKSADIPLSSFMHISEILAGLTGAGVAAQASGAGAAGSSAAASGTTAAAGSSSATAVETGASASIKAGAAVKAAAAAGSAAKATLAAKVAAGVLAVAVATGGVVAVTSSRDPNDEILTAYQEYVQSEEFEQTMRHHYFINSEMSFDPESFRYAIYDYDEDGTIELYCLGETPTEYGYSLAQASGFQYNRESQNVEWFTNDGLMLSGYMPDYSLGICQTCINGKYYPGSYIEYISNLGPKVTWHFAYGSIEGLKINYDYNFHYSRTHFSYFVQGDPKGAEAEPVPGTSLYRSIPGVQGNTEPEFELTDEEFDTLLASSLKIIGHGLAFDGQDLSMSYSEFLALKKVKSVPPPGKPSQSAKEIAARRITSPSMEIQNSEAIKAFQGFIESGQFDLCIFSKELLNPADCRFAIYDVDRDGTVDLSYLYKERSGDGTEYYVFRSCKYDRISQCVRFMFAEKEPVSIPVSSYPDAACGRCQVVKDGQTYEGYYYKNSADRESWLFSGIRLNETSFYRNYHFSFANFDWSSTNSPVCEPIDGTSLYRSTVFKSGTTIPEFSLTDEEFYALPDNSVKIVGAGAAFEGQDLSLSYDEFMALQSIDDAPQPGKPMPSADLSNPEPEQSAESAATESASEIPADPMAPYLAAYEPVFETYRAFLSGAETPGGNSVSEENIFSSPYDGRFGPLGVSEALYDYNGYNQQLGYLLQDISGDGVPELIIGTLEPPDEHVPMRDAYIYDLFTLQNGYPKRVLATYGRQAYFLLPDNSILYGASGGLGRGALFRYRFTGTDKEFVSALMMVQPDYYEVISDRENVWEPAEGDIMINEDEYQVKRTELFDQVVRFQLSPLPLQAVDAQSSETSALPTEELSDSTADYLAAYEPVFDTIRAYYSGTELPSSNQGYEDNIFSTYYISYGDLGIGRYPIDFNAGYADVGYLLQDISGDGIPELIIGDMRPHNESEKYLDDIIYDMFTLQNGSPKQVLASSSRIRFSLCSDNLILNDGSSGAASQSAILYGFNGTDKEFVRALMMQQPYYYEVTMERQNIWQPAEGDTMLSEGEYQTKNAELFANVVHLDLTPMP